MIITIRVEVLKRNILPMEAMASEGSLSCQLGNSFNFEENHNGAEDLDRF